MTEQERVRETTGAAVQAALAAENAPCLVDVREQDEWDAYHIPGILLLPLSEFASRCRAELAPDEDIVCVCEHGVRSLRAAEYLLSLGYSTVASMAGGMAAYPGPTESGGL